jgi:pyruvate dehydrogenase E2 component (dihydrolipoamide acetyltransferase)
MAEVIRMPKMSDTMEEGVIASWLKKVGDEVQSGDILAEVETDKATMELESYEDGVLLHIGVEEKSSVPVDAVIAVIGEKGENIDDLLKNTDNGSDAEQNSSSEDKDNAKEDTATATSSEAEEPVDTSSINATVITMPKMSDTMEEGTIAAWHKKVGDEVSSGDILAEVETDKATMELESYEDGTLLYIGVDAGDAVPVDAVLAVIGEKGADYESLLKAQQQSTKSDSHKEEAPKEKAAESEERQPETKQEPSPQMTSSGENGRIKASPLAKKMAESMGIDLKKVSGSGDGGRIIKRDIENYEPSVEPATEASTKTGASEPSFTIPTVVGEESFEEQPVSQMRKVIAKRLAESKFTSPHFYLTMEIDMDKAVEARKSMNELSPVKISFNDIIIKAAAAALRRHPAVNSSWLEDKIRTNKHIHVGVAVAVDEGLLVPVVRFADNKSLSHISAEVRELAKKAHEKKLQPSDWEGNTFTISNLGMFGIEEFTAIINPPDACIMAVGGIKQIPVVKNGEIKVGNTMKVTLSCDHRVVDGAVGSAFLKTFKELLEDPIRILI